MIIDLKTHDFIRAHFTNDERTIIEAEWRRKKEPEIDVEIIVAKESEPQYQRLLELISLDDLHEATYKWFREQQSAFEDEVIRLGKAQGMIIDVVENSTDLYKAMAKALFTPFDPEEDKEKLFLYKLSLFENDAIKDSNNKELKAALRKATDVISATKVAIEIVEDSK